MPAPRLFFLHGWGFDRSIWRALSEELSDIPATIADLGYFGEPNRPRIDGPTVVVAHSLGSVLALRDPPLECRALVAINGFDRFTEQADAPGVPRRLVERMLRRFRTAPAEVLHDFRRRCGVSEQAGHIDASLLGEHLQLLRDANERASTAAWNGPILSLQAGDDPIMPQGLRNGAFAGAQSIKRAQRKDGGHLLPLTWPGWCAEQIRGLLAGLS
jgi:pimeloyl-[acyl-carrier protein] methyl ester esterase